MDSPPVLVKHECNVSIRHDIMGGFPHTNLRGFYFQVVVRERTMHYYFSGSNNDLVHHYSVDGVRNGCWKFVVEAEEILECEDTAIIAIRTMLRSINICETVRPEMVRKIYSTVNSLARQVEHVWEGRIPVMVDIVRVFRQAAPNPNPSLIQDGQQSDGNRDDEDEDEDVDMDRNGDDEDEYEYEDEDEYEYEDEDEDEGEDEEEDEDEDKPVPAARSSVMALEKVKLKPKGNCTICLEGLIKATRMPCSHLFHQHCIVRWLKKNNACPLCRFQLP